MLLITRQYSLTNTIHISKTNITIIIIIYYTTGPVTENIIVVQIFCNCISELISYILPVSL
jgi:hypothetical protein